MFHQTDNLRGEEGGSKSIYLSWHNFDNFRGAENAGLSPRIPHGKSWFGIMRWFQSNMDR